MLHERSRFLPLSKHAFEPLRCPLLSLGADMRRRDFLGVLGGGAAAAWPVGARAQQPERMRRIGVLLPAAADDAEFQIRLAAFHQGLALSGWTIGKDPPDDNTPHKL